MNPLALIIVGPIIGLVVLAIIVYLVVTLLPMPGPVRNAIWIIFAILAILLICSAFGMWDGIVIR